MTLNRILIPSLFIALGLASAPRAESPSGADATTCAAFPLSVNYALLAQGETSRRIDIFGLGVTENGATLTGSIPIAFHVIHNGEEGRIPLSRLIQQIDALNEAFAPIRFRLGSMEYTDNAWLFNMGILSVAEFVAKIYLQRDPRTNLNIYTCKPRGNVIGWGIFPFLSEIVPMLDGVVIDHGVVFGDGYPGYDEGDACIHEVGHWAGLFHTWQFGCIFNDFVDDTAPERRPTFGCEFDKDTCPQPGLDPIENYMDYSDDRCSESFTEGQFTKMAAELAAFRPELWLPLWTSP
jgi:hypothetical protein